QPLLFLLAALALTTRLLQNLDGTDLFHAGIALAMASLGKLALHVALAAPSGRRHRAQAQESAGPLLLDRQADTKALALACDDHAVDAVHESLPVVRRQGGRGLHSPGDLRAR